MTDRPDRLRGQAPAPPPSNEVMLQRWGRIIACKDCWHSYLVQLQPLQPVVRICAFSPIDSQFTPNPGGQALQQIPRIVADSNFCHQFKDAVIQ